MRVFLTGAGGHIGQAVTRDLLQAGHQVVGLARSDASAAAVKELGAEVHRGDLADLDALRSAAAAADAVIHLAFDHSSITMDGFIAAAAADHEVIRAFGDELAGTGKTFIGVGALTTGDPTRDAALAANPRSAAFRTVAGFTERGIRGLLVAVPSVTHSDQDRHGFVPRLIRIARAKGVSGYVGDGGNRWPAGHTLDVARVFRLGLEQAPAGAQLVAATEEGVTVREIAETIGGKLGIPAVSVPAEQAAQHFAGFPFVTMDLTASNTQTRRLLDWAPAHPGLIADLEHGSYFAAP